MAGVGVPGPESVNAGCLTGLEITYFGSARRYQRNLRNVNGQQTRGRLNMQPSGPNIYASQSCPEKMLAHAAMGALLDPVPESGLGVLCAARARRLRFPGAH
jgi:hypothetical protein